MASDLITLPPKHENASQGGLPRSEEERIQGSYIGWMGN